MKNLLAMDRAVCKHLFKNINAKNHRKDQSEKDWDQIIVYSQRKMMMSKHKHAGWASMEKIGKKICKYKKRKSQKT